MLKITLVDAPGDQKMVLCGKLAGPWIEELQQVWENSRRHLGNRRYVVDLSEVILIDPAAHGLLATMVNDGAEMVASGLVNRWLIEALREESKNFHKRLAPARRRRSRI